MPTFGAFETVGEPLELTDERGHISTVWKAHKAGDSRQYVVKSYAPRRRALEPGQEETVHLYRDRGLDFIEGVKQTRKALADGGRCLAPILDLGTSDVGVWYATEFYPRNNLKAWIARRGGVDSAALGQIVYSVVSGCLALKRSRGYAHGNLKPANVFLGGSKGRPLPQTPFLLTDAYPASPSQLAALDAADRHWVEETLRPAIEAHDLRSIGELILQLVESRLFARPDDYNYPVQRSQPWNALGRSGDYWLKWCNELVNPQLSLETTNLEKLEAEMRPSFFTAHKPLIQRVAAGVVVVAAGAFVVMKVVEHRRAQKFETAIQAAGHALSTTNLVTAQERIAEALKLRPGDGGARELKAKIDALADQEFAAVANAAQAAFRESNFTNAMAKADWALSIRRDDAGMKQLKADAQARWTESIAAAGREQEYRSATNAARLAYESGNYTGAMSEADKALGIHADDAAMRQLKADAQQQWNTGIAAASQEKEFVSATNAAWAAFRQGNYTNALTEAGRALSIHPDDAGLKQLSAEAQARWRVSLTEANQEQEYRSATNAAWLAYQQGNYTNAMAAADKALGIHPNDAALQQLRGQAQTQWNKALAVAGSEQEYQSATNAAWLAYRQGNYTNAMAAAAKALGIHTNDAALKQLKADAEKRWSAEIAAASTVAEFRNLTNSALEESRQGRYAAAITQLDKALVIRPNDSVLKQLKTDIQTRWNEVVTAQKGKELDAVLAQASQGLSATNPTLASTNFQSALGMAAELKDSGRQKTASEGVALTTALLQADAARKKGPGSLDQEIKHLAEAVKFASAPKWVEEWQREATSRKERLAPAALPPKPNLFGVANLDFVWVTGLGAEKKGAYVAVNELSWAQYNELLKRSGGASVALTDDPNLPAWIKSSDEAARLIAALNSAPGVSATTLSQNAKWRLLTEKEYIQLAEKVVGSFETNGWTSNPKYGWVPPLEAIRRLQEQGQNLAGGMTNPPHSVTEDRLDEDGLRDVIGNVREWTAEGEVFGIHHSASPGAESSRGIIRLRSGDAPLPAAAHPGIRLAADESK